MRQCAAPAACGNAQRLLARGASCMWKRVASVVRGGTRQGGWPVARGGGYRQAARAREHTWRRARLVRKQWRLD